MPVLNVEESVWVGPIPEDEVLTARVLATKQIQKGPKDNPFTNDDGSPQYRIEFSFVVEDESSPWNGTKVWGDTPITFSTNEKCKLRNWLQAILRQEIPPQKGFDTDLAVDHTCRIVVQQNAYTKDGEEKVKNYVSDVMPVSGSSIQSLEEEPF